MRSNRYESKGEFGGWTLRGTRTGWLLETDSRWQGDRSGYRALLPYSATRSVAMSAEPDSRLDAEINEYGTTLAEQIKQAILDGHPRVRVLRRGHVIR